VWGGARDLRDLPAVLVERLQHYFLTYKLVPGERATARITRVYGHAHARKVVQAAMDDYTEAFRA
jgi:inorganic pyrophosphatase